MAFAIAFGVNFLIGGVTGLYLADVPTDTQFHGNMFTVAHFHFTLVGGVMFGFLAALYYWFPKMTGRQLDPGWRSCISGCSRSASWACSCRCSTPGCRGSRAGRRMSTRNSGRRT